MGKNFLDKMVSIKDLEIFFDPKLKFDCHINNTINKSNKIFVFIKRNCADFTYKFTLKSLYYFLVRSISDCGLHINQVINK